MNSIFNQIIIAIPEDVSVGIIIGFIALTAIGFGVGAIISIASRSTCGICVTILSTIGAACACLLYAYTLGWITVI